MDCNCFHVGSVLVMPETAIWSKNVLFCLMWARDFRVQFKANPQLLNLAWTYCGQYYVLSSEKAWWKADPGQQTDEVPPTGSHQLPKNAFIRQCTGGLTTTDSTSAVSLGGWWKGLWDDKGSGIIFDVLVTAHSVSWWDFKVISANEDWPRISPSWNGSMAVG